ncbi:MAG: hypothetical protein N2645_13425 [Clostridia bacterium]|nr:hypothetical protein [Clostridia bacterium]
MYKGVVLRSESLDPSYKVKFNFENEKYCIRDGGATFVRQAPTPVVMFDDYTDYILERLEVDTVTIQNLKLEIGKTVCDYIFSTMDLKNM